MAPNLGHRALLASVVPRQAGVGQQQTTARALNVKLTIVIHVIACTILFLNLASWLFTKIVLLRKRPAGDSTINIPRPRIGSVPYGMFFYSHSKYGSPSLINGYQALSSMTAHFQELWLSRLTMDHIYTLLSCSTFLTPSM